MILIIQIFAFAPVAMLLHELYSKACMRLLQSLKNDIIDALFKDDKDDSGYSQHCVFLHAISKQWMHTSTHVMIVALPSIIISALILYRTLIGITDLHTATAMLTPIAVTIVWLIITSLITFLFMLYQRKRLYALFVENFYNDDPVFADHCIALSHNGETHFIKRLVKPLFMAQSTPIIFRFIELLSERETEEHDMLAKQFIFTLGQIKEEMPMMLIEDDWPASMKRLFSLPELNFAYHKENDIL